MQFIGEFYIFLKKCCKKNPFYGKIKMCTLGPFVIESFVIVGSFDCHYTFLKNVIVNFSFFRILKICVLVDFFKWHLHYFAQGSHKYHFQGYPYHSQFKCSYMPCFHSIFYISSMLG